MDPIPSEPVDVATWNLKNFPLTADTPKLVADQIAALGLELVAFEETNSQAPLDELTKYLPGFQNAIPGYGGPGIGLLWNTSALTLRNAQLLFAKDDHTFPREPIQVEANLVDGPSVMLVVVHLKAGTSPSDEGRRVEASTTIERHVRAISQADEPHPFLVLGDFNEALSDPKSADVFGPWLNAPDDYRFLTHELAKGGQVTYLPSKIMLDHMISTASLDKAIGTAKPTVPALDRQLGIYRSKISDHLPVVLRLFGKSTRPENTNE